MKCGEVQEHLSAWLDGEVPEGLHQRLADHVAGCPACRAELEAMERLDAALAGLEVPVPRSLADKVKRRLSRPAASPWLQSLALAVCLALGIFLGSSLTGRLYPWPASANGITNDVASLEIFQDYPQGSVGGAFSYQGEEDGSA
jgi:anti-sigma factor RsiW|uniref:Putative zinc-finger domain-containing protein n=1 Tax=Desulfobacca acetoxidans TaxID=60893 RepID=A0A7V6A4E2_9BACT